MPAPDTPTSPPPAPEGTLLAPALAGDPRAVRALVERLSPVVQARVARVLLRRSGAALGRDVRQEVEDLAQDVFVALFEGDARILRSWSPGGGLSLANFVGLVAERRTISALRSRRQSPWTEEPVDEPALALRVGASEAGQAVDERDLLRAVLDRLRAALSPKGWSLFALLMVEQRPIEAVCAETQMTAAAVYAWRSRLAKQARAARAEVLGEMAEGRR